MRGPGVAYRTPRLFRNRAPMATGLRAFYTSLDHVNRSNHLHVLKGPARGPWKMTFIEKSTLGTCLVIAAVCLSWMSASKLSNAQLPPVVGETPRASAGVRVGSRLKDFTLKDEEGEPTACSTLVEGRKALLYFYSGCCGHCSGQLPELARITRRLQSESIAIVGVEYFGDSETCSSNRAKYDLVGTSLADSNGEACKTFAVGDLTVFTADRRGIVRYRGGVGDLRAIEDSLGLPEKTLTRPSR